MPKSHVYRIVRDGQVRVNGSRARPDLRLEVGDRLRLPPIRSAEDKTFSLPRELLSLTIPVLHEDDELLVLDKPSGLAVHGGSGLRGGVIEILRHNRRSNDFLELAHRLDKDTSGCLIVAKTPSSLRYMHVLFRENKDQHRITKIYHALVIGDWKGGVRQIDFGLRKHRTRDSKRRSIVSRTGDAAWSQFTPLKRVGRLTLMEITLGTGRMHQIRAHAAAAGHPVVGDKLYGDRDSFKKFRQLGIHRQLLHASRVAFAHPETRRRLTIHSPYPEDFRQALTIGESR